MSTRSGFRFTQWRGPARLSRSTVVKAGALRWSTARAARPTTAPTTTDAEVEWVTDARQLERVIEPWDDLARHAVEANVFYERWALLPALRHLRGGDDRVGVLLVWEDAARARLLGLMPASRTLGYRGIPLRHWRNWCHVHCPLGTPLVREGHVEVAMQAFFDWFAAEGKADVISLEHFGADGPLHRYVLQRLPTLGHALGLPERWQRALLCSPLSGEQYLLTHLRKKKLKELRRLRRRMAELGRFEVAEFRGGGEADVQRWIDEFLRLERSGWKGATGTALHCKAAERAFAVELIQGAAARGQLMMLELSLDGRPVAMKLSFAAAAQGAFALKIAFDERFEAYSPGVLLELENISALLDRRTVPWMDSCAIPGHPMIEHLWAERRTMCNLRVSARRPPVRSVLRVLWGLESMYRRFKGAVEP